MANTINYHECNKCGRQYLTLRGIIRHLQTKHSEKSLSEYTSKQESS